MSLAAEGNRTATANSGTVPRISDASRVFAAISALALMFVAANRLLSYLWWAACYSAWSGIPKMAQQASAAGTRASFNEWSFIFLEIASIALLCAAMRLRYAFRILASLIITVAATAVFALALSWFKQGIH